MATGGSAGEEMRLDEQLDAQSDGTDQTMHALRAPRSGRACRRLPRKRSTRGRRGCLRESTGSRWDTC
jgi:hypothetical protein